MRPRHGRYPELRRWEVTEKLSDLQLKSALNYLNAVGTAAQTRTAATSK